MASDDVLDDYFRALFDYSASLLDRLPIRFEPQPMSYVSQVLESAVDARRGEEVARLAAIARPQPRPAGNGPVGLNTIGILADRLTILAIKVWFLRHKHKDLARADQILSEDVPQVIAAMRLARPGSSTLLTKITGLKASVHNADWNECYYGLLTSNLLMWEAQESMYVNNMSDYGADEVRACLSWCSYGNLRRNQYISSSEVRYWSDVAATAAADAPSPSGRDGGAILERRRTVLSPYVTLCERVVEVPGSGESQVFHSLDQADYVSVLAETIGGQVVLVRQFRPAVECMTLELPSGLLEAGEDPGACAARELQEEAGFRPTAPLVFLGKVAPDVGRLGNALWAYHAQGVEEIAGWSAEPGVERLLMSKTEFREAVARGELTDAPHLGVLALAQAQGRF